MVLKASLNAIIISSGYTFLSSQILKIRSIDLETDGSFTKAAASGRTSANDSRKMIAFFLLQFCMTSLAR